MSFFQNELDEAILHREAVLKSEVTHLISQHQLTYSIFEYGTGGFISGHYLSLKGLENQFDCGISSTKNEHISRLLDLPLEQVNNIHPNSFCRLLLESLYVKTKSLLCIAIHGKLEKNKTTKQCEAVIQFGFKLKRSVQIRSLNFSTNEALIYNKIYETSLGFLKFFLMNEFKAIVPKTNFMEETING